MVLASIIYIVMQVTCSSALRTIWTSSLITRWCTKQNWKIKCLQCTAEVRNGENIVMKIGNAHSGGSHKWPSEKRLKLEHATIVCCFHLNNEKLATKEIP